uniref:Golgin subfamily A conserved domain-containing protein n=1 Tax=Chlorocebus sabaeus TaxID=60711 RepID=A0A0D9RIA1_CHLSB
MWSQPRLPPCPVVSEETDTANWTQPRKLLVALNQRNSPCLLLVYSLAGVKRKKRKQNGSSTETTTSGGCHSPGDESLKGPQYVLPVDSGPCEGAAFPTLDMWKELTVKDTRLTKQPPADDTMLPGGVPCPGASLASIVAPQNDDASPNLMDESKTFSSTESLQQLSQQLNGVASESATRIYAEVPASSATLKDLEKEHIQEIVDQLEVEKQESQQNQGALKRQLQVTGILMFEKAELKTALYHTEHAARQFEEEAEDLASHLQYSWKHVGELQQEQRKADRYNNQLTGDSDALRLKLYKNSNSNKELKQENSALAEQLPVVLTDKAGIQRNLEELKKKLELTDLTLQQLSSWCEGPNANQQLQQPMEEWAQLESTWGRVIEWLKYLQMERDQYAQYLHGESAMWWQRMREMSEKVHTLRQERAHSMSRVQELETSLAELRNQMAEPPPPELPAGPSEVEQQLQAEAEHLWKELENLTAQVQETQVQENEGLSRLNQEQEERLLEQEERLLELERKAELWEEQVEALRQTVQNDRTTISRALSQKHELKKHLGELKEMVTLSQFKKSREVGTSLWGREVGGQRQLPLVSSTEVELKSQKAQSLPQQRNQRGHLQPYYQQLISEKEALHRQLLLQIQLVDQLQHQRKVAEMARQELQETQETELLRAGARLQAQLSFMALPGEGDGLQSEEEEEEPWSMLSILEDLENWEAMTPFHNLALASAEEEQAQPHGRLKEQRVHCQHLHLVALAQRQPEAATSAPGTGGDSCGQSHGALQGTMEKLQSRFMELMQEKEWVERLGCRCIQLSGETGTIRKYITSYQSQRSVLKTWHQEDEYVSRLAQDKEEMKVTLLELVLQLVGDHNEWHGRFLAVAQNPADEPAPGDPAPPGDWGCRLAGCVEPEQEERGGSPHNSPTAQQIMRLLHEVQNPQERPGLGSNACIPIFYWAQENKVKITII